MSDRFPREDLGETEQFRITSGVIAIQGEAAPPYYGNRHSYINEADRAPSDREYQPTFKCMLCPSWGIMDKDAHVCSEEKATAKPG